MEEQALYGNQRRLKTRPGSQKLEKIIAHIRQQATLTRENLILDESRKAISVDEKNQAMLQSFLDSTVQITDMFFE